MGKSPPDPPSPRETSAASTGTSVSTAVANANLGNVNQVTPDGTLTYDQTGSYEWTDPYTNQSYTIPRFTATQTLSPEQQAIREQTLGAQNNLATLANNQSSFLNDYMAQPIDLNNEAVESRLYDLGSRRLDPRFEREEAGLRTQLINRGIREGSEAFNSEMERFSQGRNDAYNQLLLTGRGQAVQEALTERNQPINEITALLSGSQVSQPNFVNANMPTIPTTDNAGLINNHYQQQMAQWQAKQQGIGGLFSGLGSLAFALSDERAKEDIEKVGKTDDGQNIYAYRYKAGGPMQLGLMAQEVEKKKPEAVKEFGGLKHVNYGKALSLGAS